jgi:hypothetical protein
MTRKSLSAITADVGPVPQIPVRDDAPASVDPPGATPPPRRQRARRASPADPSPDADLDDATLGRWRWQLGATSRKAVAARARADAAMAAWERLITDAQSAGVPARLVVAAAADAGLDVPGAQ